MEKLPRDVNIIYANSSSCPDIIFVGEKLIEEKKPTFKRPYNQKNLSDIFRIMGCHHPLNDSMSEWIFNFLKNSPYNQIKELIQGDEIEFKKSYVSISRFQFHRLISASLYIHYFRKIRYLIDFRLAIDFHEEKRFFIILLSGAPGTGKSTIASLIASRMSVNHIISTDSIRHAMRSNYPKEKFPTLHCSTYECGTYIDPNNELSEDERVIFLNLFIFFFF